MGLRWCSLVTAGTWPARSSPGLARGQALVQAVRDQHDRTLKLVVEPAVEGVVVPFVRGLALGLRQRLLGLQRVVDDDDVRTPPGKPPADRGGDARALDGRLEFRYGLAQEL